MTIHDLQRLIMAIHNEPQYQLETSTKNALRQWYTSLQQFPSLEPVTHPILDKINPGNSDLLVLVAVHISNTIKDNTIPNPFAALQLFREVSKKRDLSNIHPDIAHMYIRANARDSLFINIPQLPINTLRLQIRRSKKETIPAHEIWGLCSDSLHVPATLEFMLQEHGPLLTATYFAFAVEDHVIHGQYSSVSATEIYKRLHASRPDYKSYWDLAATWIKDYRKNHHLYDSITNKAPEISNPMQALMEIYSPEQLATALRSNDHIQTMLTTALTPIEISNFELQ